MQAWQGPAPYSVEPVRPAATLEAVRAELARQAQHDPVVRAAFTMAMRDGLSDVDAFSLLAYHLLDALVRTRGAYFEHMVCCHPNLPHCIGETATNPAGG